LCYTDRRKARSRHDNYLCVRLPVQPGLPATGT